MKRGSTLLLRGVISLMALGALAICIFALPIGLRSDASGYYRPIIITMYIAAIPFFIALYQGFILLNYIDKNTAFSELAVKALGIIKISALSISGLYLVTSPYFYHVADLDDAPGVLAIALIIVAASFVIAIFAGVLQKLLENVVDIKKENELTV